MNFKEQLKADIKGFLNTDEFGERMLINGKQMSVIFDTDQTSGSGTSETPGVYSAHKVMFVSAEEFGSKPKPGSEILVNGKMRYTVTGEVISEDGLYTIPIGRKRVQ